MPICQCKALGCEGKFFLDKHQKVCKGQDLGPNAFVHHSRMERAAQHLERNTVHVRSDSDFDLHAEAMAKRPNPSQETQLPSPSQLYDLAEMPESPRVYETIVMLKTEFESRKMSMPVYGLVFARDP